MKPPDTERAENIVKIQLLRACLADRCVRAVRDAECPADAESPLGKIETVPADPPDSICLLVIDQACVNAALFHEIREQFSDLVVRKSGDNPCVHVKTFVKSADDIIFSAALPYLEGTRRTHSPLSRVEAQHDLAE